MSGRLKSRYSSPKDQFTIGASLDGLPEENGWEEKGAEPSKRPCLGANARLREACL